MRQLDTAIPWNGEFWETDTYQYQRQSVAGVVRLYARTLDASAETYVLGAFDTPEQADLFTALHRDNPLFVPALQAEFDWPVSASAPVTYSGIYRVGMKRYRVSEVEHQRLRVEYSEGYKVELLGETSSEADACLLVYNHFDGRLRGCKLC